MFSLRLRQMIYSFVKRVIRDDDDELAIVNFFFSNRIVSYKLQFKIVSCISELSEKLQESKLKKKIVNIFFNWSFIYTNYGWKCHLFIEGRDIFLKHSITKKIPLYSLKFAVFFVSWIWFILARDTFITYLVVISWAKQCGRSAMFSRNFSSAAYSEFLRERSWLAHVHVG